MDERATGTSVSCGKLLSIGVAPLVVAVLLASGCGGSDEAETTGQPGDLAFDLPARNGGADGVRATLSYKGRDRTEITVDGLDEGESAGGGPNPVWLRTGSCDERGRIVFQLAPLRGSSSTTTVGLGVTALLNGDYAVAVGLTKEQPDDVACGDVPDEAPVEGDS
jgi:hypothetical protein